MGCAEVGTSSSAGAGTAGSSGHTVPVVAAGGRDVAFRPQRMLACLGTLLVLAHMQPQQPVPERRGRLLTAAGALDGSDWSVTAQLTQWE